MNSEKNTQPDEATVEAEVVETPLEAVEFEEASREQGRGEPAEEAASPEILETELIRKLDEADGRATEAHGNFLRAVADLENYRKRALREKEELRKYAAADFIEDLLPALDNLELGLQSAQEHHPEAKGVTDGFAMVVSQLKGIMEQNGIVEINPVAGDDFDANLHDCVAHQSDETIEAEKVIHCARKGYKYHERLLRPAAVTVSSGKG